MKSPSAVVILKDNYCGYRIKTNYIKNNLEYTLLKDLVNTSKIYYDPDIMNFNSVIEEDNEMLKIYKEFSSFSEMEEDILPWIIRIEFDKEVMIDKGVVMEDIYFAIKKYDPTKIVYQFTDDNSKELIGRISLKMKNDKEVPGIQDQNNIIDIFKNINEDLMNNVSIKGIQNIKDIIISENKKITKIDNEIQNIDNYYLETDGTNLIELINNRYVDPNNTFSNDIIEMYNIFGIESARERLISEIIEVVKHEGEYINTRHISKWKIKYSNKGLLFSINRQGINSGDIGPLAKSSFEDTTDQLIKASIFSEKDKLNGVSSNIMLGQTIKCGTGVIDLLLDEEKLISELIDLGEKEEEFLDIDESDINVIMDIEDNEGDCAEDNFKFSHE